MRTAARTDENHTDIVNALRKCGYSVLSLASLGNGVPDLLIARGGLTAMVEVKSEKGTLLRTQIAFAKGWNGRIEVARSLDDVARIASNWHKYGSEPF